MTIVFNIDFVTETVTVETTNALNFGSSSGSVAATWGSITGTLSSQADLQQALNGKLPTTATTADIADSADKRYVTDAQKVVLGNTSNTNTGDNATNSQYSGLAALIDKEISLDLWVGNSTTTNQAETILRTIPVVGGVVEDEDLVWITQQISTSQTSGTLTTRARVGAEAVPVSIAAATLVLDSTLTATAGGLYAPINNYISVNGSNFTAVLRAIIVGAAGVQLIDVATPTLTNTWYIYITSTKSIAGGTVSLRSSLIKRERA